MEKINQTVCGIDVHQHMLMCTIVTEDKSHKVKYLTKEFKNFQKGFSSLHSWLRSFNVQRIIFESTGIYWNHLHSYSLIRKQLHIKAVILSIGNFLRSSRIILGTHYILKAGVWQFPHKFD